MWLKRYTTEEIKKFSMKLLTKSSYLKYLMMCIIQKFKISVKAEPPIVYARTNTVKTFERSKSVSKNVTGAITNE